MILHWLATKRLPRMQLSPLCGWADFMDCKLYYLWGFLGISNRVLFPTVLGVWWGEKYLDLNHQPPARFISGAIYEMCANVLLTEQQHSIDCWCLGRCSSAKPLTQISLWQSNQHLLIKQQQINGAGWMTRQATKFTSEINKKWYLLFEVSPVLFI